MNKLSWPRGTSGVARIVSCIGAIFAMLLAGCGKADFPKAKLSGSVTIDGAPVTQGAIDFQPQERNQGPSATATIAAGRFQANVPVGKQKVFFHATRETGKMVDVFGKLQPETVNIIPPAYHGGVDITVAADSATRDFELVSK